MAPFIIRDFLEFAGICQGREVIYYSIINIKANTSTLNYIIVENTIIGIFGSSLNTKLGNIRVGSYIYNFYYILS